MAAADVFVAPVERFAVVDRFTAGFPAVAERVDAPVEDFARVDADLRVVPERELAALRVPVDLRVVDLRPLPVRERDADPLELEVDPSSDHLPDITRCAASATASAMIEPSLVALDIMLVAAAEAESAASSPASRILRRAAGLALIAAAAAARPAASISLLIAALASLSTVLFVVEDERELDDVFLAGRAILNLLRRGKDNLLP